MNVEIGTEAALSFSGNICFEFWYCVFAVRVLIFVPQESGLRACVARFSYLAGNFMLKNNLKVTKVSCPKEVKKHDL
jgi:hypothetical protein